MADFSLSLFLSAQISKNMRAEYVGLTDMKFIIPTLPQEEIVKKLLDLHDRIVKGFQDLQQL